MRNLDLLLAAIAAGVLWWFVGDFIQLALTKEGVLAALMVLS